MTMQDLEKVKSVRAQETSAGSQKDAALQRKDVQVCVDLHSVFLLLSSLLSPPLQSTYPHCLGSPVLHCEVATSRVVLSTFRRVRL